MGRPASAGERLNASVRVAGGQGFYGDTPRSVEGLLAEGVDYLCLDMALASLRLQGPTGKLVLHTEQNRMRHSAQETLRIAARDRHPGIYAPLLFGAVYGAITAALEGALDVHVPDGASTAQPGSIDYEEFLELAFDYLRSGF